MRSEDFPELPGYLTVAAVAKLFDITKESIFWRIYHMKTFKKVYRIGSKEETKRPVIVLDEAEVMEVLARERHLVPEPESDKQELIAWHRRVKDWARANNWTQTPIQPQGRPAHAMIIAYVAANPADPRPRPDLE